MTVRELAQAAEQLERGRKYEQAAAAWVAVAAHPDVGQLGLTPGEPQRRNARNLLEAGTAAEAITALEALPPEARTVETVTLLARAYLEAKRFDDAVAAARQAIDLDPDNVLARKVLGRAHMAIAERLAEGSAAMHWQEAIEQFNDILVLFNPYDELAQMLKRHCVLCRTNSFSDTMTSEFRRFTGHIGQGNHAAAFDVLNELTRVVVEQAFDVAPHNPKQTVQTVGDFIAMVARYSQSSGFDLVATMGLTFCRLHSAEMWARYFADDNNAAELALERAIKAAPQTTLAWTSKAELMALLERDEDMLAALTQADRFAASHVDHLMLASTLFLVGRFDEAEARLSKIDVEQLKSEVVRPDRVESILQRLRADLKDSRSNNETGTINDLTVDDLADRVKRKLATSQSAAGEPNAPTSGTEQR